MQWTNKGHQFDKIAEKLKSFQTIYIYGAGETGRNVAEMVSFLGTGICFVDRDKSKQLSGVNHNPVISPEEFDSKILCREDQFIIVFAVKRYDYLYMAKHLLGEGYRENIDFFFHDTFLAMYLNILSVYKFNKVYIEQMTQMVTTYCSLRCKECMMSIPYLKNKKHTPLERLKEDADLLFSKVDFIKNYGPGGGEIFLYPDLGQFITYIIENYSNQIGTILLITNATVLPDKTVMKVIADNGLRIKISSYETVEGWKEKRDMFVALCEESGVAYYEQKIDAWIDMGWNEKKDLTKHRAQFMFDQCSMICRGFKDGTEHYCLHGLYTNTARSICGANGEELNFMDNYTDKKTILEYNLGYSRKGYLEICSQCNGYFGINKNQICVAEQL